jgi:methylenetetrahydrofolate dehydrogenase (NADP+) / methenyltetrahydrofolate cyclohydrolase
MTALVLDGAALAREVFEELKPRVEALVQRGVRPGLATVVAGNNPASSVYVRNKVRACEEVGLHVEMRKLPEDTSASTVAAAVDELNDNPAVHGIIVQLPLPAGIEGQPIVQRIAIAKDVDGFNWCNLGALVDGHLQLAPCTPLGVMRLLEKTGQPMEGRHAVVIGRSSLVGKPLALMLIAAGATVTVCNSKTRDLSAHTKRADILVAAVGHAGLVTADMVKPGAVVIDVGINRLANGKLAGDVDYEAVARQASAITPVPGGVGRMTVAMLVSNTVLAAERSLGP